MEINYAGNVSDLSQKWNGYQPKSRPINVLIGFLDWTKKVLQVDISAFYDSSQYWPIINDTCRYLLNKYNFHQLEDVEIIVNDVLKATTQGAK